MSARRGDWMQTFGGRQFWPLDPRADEVFIGDIAHALAQQCRYGGHTLRFYSVAEHCVLMARAVPPEFKLWALMHDASEAYLTDVIRPVKPHLAGYKAAEAEIMCVICERFGLAQDMPGAVHEADNRILLDEQEQAMATPPAPWEATAGLDPLGVTLRFWAPAEAEFWFMTEFDQLTGGTFASTAPFHNPGPALGGEAMRARFEARRNG